MKKIDFSTYITEEIMKNPITTCPLWVIKSLCFLFKLMCNKKQLEEVKTDRLIKKRVLSSTTIAKVHIKKVIMRLKYKNLASQVKSFVNK